MHAFFGLWYRGFTEIIALYHRAIARVYTVNSLIQHTMVHKRLGFYEASYKNRQSNYITMKQKKNTANHQ